MATSLKVTAVGLDCRCLCVLLTSDWGIGHDVSATASINQPRRLRFIAYVMTDLAIIVYVMTDLAIIVCGFGYVSQKPNSNFDVYKPKIN